MLLNRVYTFGPVLMIIDKEFYLMYSDVYMKEYQNYPGMNITQDLYHYLEIIEIYC